MNELRRRCERRLRGIEIPQPFDIRKWCDIVAERRGRELRLYPTPGLSASAPCGMWLSVGRADYIFYEANTSPLHADHFILHEVGHMLGEHTVGLDIADSVLVRLLPDLDPRSVRRVLGRVGYLDEQEQEAEMLASLVRASIRHGGDAVARHV